MKKIILLLIAFIFILILSFIKIKTDVYLNLADYKSFDRLDIQVEIDKEMIFNDTVFYHAFQPTIVNYEMKIGFHKVKVSSKEANIVNEKNIFLFFNQYVLIEFFNEDENKKNNPSFSIETCFNPHYIE